MLMSCVCVCVWINNQRFVDVIHMNDPSSSSFSTMICSLVRAYTHKCASHSHYMRLANIILMTCFVAPDVLRFIVRVFTGCICFAKCANADRAMAISMGLGVFGCVCFVVYANIYMKTRQSSRMCRVDVFIYDLRVGWTTTTTTMLVCGAAQCGCGRIGGGCTLCSSWGGSCASVFPLFWFKA